jgi:hypothetical protein
MPAELAAAQTANERRLSQSNFYSNTRLKDIEIAETMGRRRRRAGTTVWTAAPEVDTRLTQKVKRCARERMKIGSGERTALERLGLMRFARDAAGMMGSGRRGDDGRKTDRVAAANFDERKCQKAGGRDSVHAVALWVDHFDANRGRRVSGRAAGSSARSARSAAFLFVVVLVVVVRAAVSTTAPARRFEAALGIPVLLGLVFSARTAALASARPIVVIIVLTRSRGLATPARRLELAFGISLLAATRRASAIVFAVVIAVALRTRRTTTPARRLELAFGVPSLAAI